MKSMTIVALLAFLASMVWLACKEPNGGTAGANPDKATVDFNFHVKPILSDKCFACHGPDEKKRQAEFRLDTEEGAFKALKSDGHNFAIVKGNPDSSYLIKRIFSEDPAFRMPPAESNLILTEAEKRILKKWIEQGAEYKQHWAFIPPVKPELPDVSSDWGINEIDRFVAAKLEEAGLAPNDPADKERLIRRVSFDLTGLPPSLEQVDKFLGDESRRLPE